MRVLDRRVRVDQNPPGSADDNPDEDGDDEDCDGLKDVSSEEQKARGLMSAGSTGRRGLGWLVVRAEEVSRDRDEIAGGGPQDRQGERDIDG